MSNLEQARTPEVIASEIRGYTSMMLTNAIEIGRRMCEVKELLPHGTFGNWIKENTGYSASTANNFMRLFNAYADEQFSLFGAEIKSQTLGNLGYTKALELLALPASEREEFVETHNVEEMSTRELREAIRERDEAINRADELEGEVRKLSEDWESAKADLSEAKAALQKPIEAVVTSTDSEEIEKAVEDALAKAEEAHKSDIDALMQKLEKAAKDRESLERKLEKTKEAVTEAELCAQSGADTYIEEAKRAKEEVERLKREIMMSDPVTAEFKGLFEQASVIAAKLIRLVSEAPEANADNLKAALGALGKQILDGAQR